MSKVKMLRAAVRALQKKIQEDLNRKYSRRMSKRDDIHLSNTIKANQGEIDRLEKEIAEEMIGEARRAFPDEKIQKFEPATRKDAGEAVEKRNVARRPHKDKIMKKGLWKRKTQDKYKEVQEKLKRRKEDGERFERERKKRGR